MVWRMVSGCWGSGIWRRTVASTAAGYSCSTIGRATSQPPAQTTATLPSATCSDSFTVTVNATGGLSPYNFVWTNAYPLSPANDSTNSAWGWAYVPATVNVTSADGQSTSRSFYSVPYCSGERASRRVLSAMGGASPHSGRPLRCRPHLKPGEPGRARLQRRPQSMWWGPGREPYLELAAWAASALQPSRARSRYREGDRQPSGSLKALVLELNHLARFGEVDDVVRAGEGVLVRVDVLTPVPCH